MDGKRPISETVDPEKWRKFHDSILEQQKSLVKETVDTMIRSDPTVATSIVWTAYNLYKIPADIVRNIMGCLGCMADVLRFAVASPQLYSVLLWTFMAKCHSIHLVCLVILYRNVQSKPKAMYANGIHLSGMGYVAFPLFSGCEHAVILGAI